MDIEVTVISTTPLTESTVPQARFARTFAPRPIGQRRPIPRGGGPTME
jgi:hypothetical protein